MTVTDFVGKQKASPAHTGEAVDSAVIELTRRRLQDHKDIRGYSEMELGANVSKRTGEAVAGSTIGLYLRGKYTGDNGELTRKIVLYLDDEEQRLAIGGPVPFVRTSVAREIERAVLIAEKTGMIAILSLAAGFGKTTTIRQLLTDRNAIYIPSTMELNAPFMMMMELAFRLGAVSGPGKRTAPPVREIVRMLIRRNRPTIFFDEGQTLDLPRIDNLRRIADQAQCALVLSGNEQVYERAESASAAHAQYTSRVIARVHLGAERMKQADVRLIASQIVDKEAVDASIDLLHNAGKREGTFRTVRGILEVAKILFETSSPSRDHVLKAMAYVKGGAA
jgi:DNA transposition AAA+ family ATPase